MTISLIGKAIVGFFVVIAWGLIIWAVEMEARRRERIARARQDVERAALKQAGEGQRARREIVV